MLCAAVLVAPAGVGQGCTGRAGGGRKGCAAVYDGEFGPETLALDDSRSRQRRCVGAIAAPHTAYRSCISEKRRGLAGVQEGVRTPRSVAGARQGKGVQPKEPKGRGLTAQSTRRNGGMSAAVRAPDAPTCGTTHARVCARHSARPNLHAQRHLVRGHDCQYQLLLISHAHLRRRYHWV